MPPLVLAWFVCQSLDTGTTLYARHRFNATELNPLMRPAGLTLKVSANLTGFFAYRKASSGQKTAIASTFTLAGCVPGGWNLAQIQQAK